MLNVCPFCQHSLNIEIEHCSVCSSSFLPSDWPSEAFSIEGMLPHLLLKWADNTWAPYTNEFVVGREPGFNGLTLSHPTVSRAHVKFSLNNGTWQVEKLGKSFLLNGQSKASAILSSGDTIQIGTIIMNISITYVPVLVTPVTDGILKSSKVQQLYKKTYIGSDDFSCNIIISGADRNHALIYQHEGTGDWWIVDCASGSGTRVNGSLIRNERLHRGDRISVAGIDMCFSGEDISIGQNPAKGLAVDLCHVSVERNNYKILQDVSF